MDAEPRKLVAVHKISGLYRLPASTRSVCWQLGPQFLCAKPKREHACPVARLVRERQWRYEASVRREGHSTVGGPIIAFCWNTLRCARSLLQGSRNEYQQNNREK